MSDLWKTIPSFSLSSLNPLESEALSSENIITAWDDVRAGCVAALQRSHQ